MREWKAQLRLRIRLFRREKASFAAIGHDHEAGLSRGPGVGDERNCPPFGLFKPAQPDCGRRREYLRGARDVGGSLAGKGREDRP